jgi:hypothetical protein
MAMISFRGNSNNERDDEAAMTRLDAIRAQIEQGFSEACEKVVFPLEAEFKRLGITRVIVNVLVDIGHGEIVDVAFETDSGETI